MDTRYIRYVLPEDFFAGQSVPIPHFRLQPGKPK
jgi:hypothetical protein